MEQPYPHVVTLKHGRTQTQRLTFSVPESRLEKVRNKNVDSDSE